MYLIRFTRLSADYEGSSTCLTRRIRLIANTRSASRRYLGVTNRGLTSATVTVRVALKGRRVVAVRDLVAGAIVPHEVRDGMAVFTARLSPMSLDSYLLRY